MGTGGLLMILALTPVSAQQAVTGEKLEAVTVTASPDQRDANDMAQPVTVVRGAAWARQREWSLGASLTQEAGVGVSGFGHAVGRPTLRGQEGARVRITENGQGLNDVSALSGDHAVALDTLSTKQVEILRGPATLMFGGAAIGGLVNAVSDRIPLAPGLNKVKGAADTEVGERGQQQAGVRIQSGGENWALSTSLQEHQMPDVRLPARWVSTTGRYLPQSSSQAQAQSIGGAWFGEQQSLGLATSALEQNYGIPGGEDVRIALKQSRHEARWQGHTANTSLAPWFSQWLLVWSGAHYHHEERVRTENEGTVVGTQFEQKSQEARLQLNLAPRFGWNGAAGVNWGDRRLQARGDEAYLPDHRAKQLGVFATGDRPWGPGFVEAGWRIETDQLETAQTNLRHTLGHWALGYRWPINPTWTLSSLIQRGQRAPSAPEALALGPHAASQTYEIGRADLKPETVTHLELGLRYQAGPLQAKGSLYQSRYDAYIYGTSIDANHDGQADWVDAQGQATPSGEGFRVTQYRQDRAQFEGREFELHWQIEPASSQSGSWLRLVWDHGRGRLSDGTPLPRQLPWRLSLQAERRWGNWRGWMSLQHLSAQHQLAALETSTPSSTRMDLELSHHWAQGQVPGLGAASTLQVFLRGRNVTDAVVRNHASYLKDTVPMAGRSWTLGARLTF